MTLEEIERTIPGYSGMTPEQQANIATRLRLRTAAQQAQQPQQQGQPTIGSSALPIMAGVGASKLMGGGAAAMAPAATTAATASSPWSLSGIGSTGNYLLPAAGAVGALDLISNDRRGARGIVQGGLSGAAIGSNWGLPGAIAGGAIGAGVGIAKTLEGGKSKDQQGRDKSRASLQQLGLYDKDFNLTLSDGTKVNMGLDGSVTNYNVDFNKEGIGDVVALVNPLAFLIAQGDQKRANDLAGELTNAIYASKDPRAEAKRLYEQLGASVEQLNTGIDQLKVDDETKKVFKGTLGTLGLPSEQMQQTSGGGNKDIYAAFSKIARMQAPKPQPVDRSGEMRSTLLRSMLADATTPMEYPRNQTEKPVQNQNLTSTMYRIAGL